MPVREAARRAVELDDALAEAHAALGFALLGHETQWDTALVHQQRALELNPNYATARVWYAGQLAMEGRLDEADAAPASERELRAVVSGWINDYRQRAEELRHGLLATRHQACLGRQHLQLMRG